MSNFLVVGADSFVGSRLISQLRNQGHSVTGTTRRQATISPGRVFLDVNNPGSFKIPDNVDCVFLVAGITNFVVCETNPDAWKVNVEAMPYLASRFLKSGAFVFFISTNAVFGGAQPCPGEDDPHHPSLAYSKQKSMCEVAIRSLAEKLDCIDHLAVIRLTKVIGPNTSPLLNWFDSWKKDQVVRPFSDLIFSPISLDFVVKSLGILGERPVSGNLHLSGTENITYFEFAKALADRMGIHDSLIEPTRSVDTGIEVLFSPRYVDLGMKRTSELLESVVANVVSNKIASFKDSEMGS